MNKPRIIFLHGNESNHWSFAWAGWLKEELEKLGFDTFFETLPDSIFARAEYWLPFLEDHIQAGENDVIIGWSSGATAAMRYIEDTKVRGSVLISPSYTDLGDEIENMSGYYDEPWLWDQIKANQEKCALFYSNNDPFIPQREFTFIAEKIDPELHMISGAGHFIEQDTFPQLLAYLKNNYS